MSQQLPSLKIKLNVKKEQTGDAPKAANQGAQAPPTQPNNTTSIALAGATGAPRPGNGGVPGPTSKPIKLKVPKQGKPLGAPRPHGPGAGPSRGGGGAGKRPAGAMGSMGGPKRIKLGSGFSGPTGTMGLGKIKLKVGPSLGAGIPTTATAGAPDPPPKAPSTMPTMPSGLPIVRLGSAQQPIAMPNMPKKRGRKPKGTVGRPPSANRKDILNDEVKYHIQAPPPRAFSLRATASQGTLHTENARGVPSPMSVGAIDTAGTGAPPDAVPGMAMASTPSAPAIEQLTMPIPDIRPPTQDEVMRLLNRIWDKDAGMVFRQPVTDAEAPDYSKMITQPMDLSTMKARVGAGAYPTWDSVASDLFLMFTNALTYNIEGDAVWTYANKLKTQATAMLKSAREGKTGKPRGSGNTAARREAALAKAAARREADQARAAARAEQRAAQEQKVLKKAGVISDEEENTARMSYRSAPGESYLATWGGLGGGASAEGAAVGWGTQLLRPSNAMPKAATYAASLLRFARGLSGRAKAMAEALAARAMNASDVAIAPPHPPPAPVAAPAAAAPTGGGGGKGKGSKNAAGAAPQKQAAKKAAIAPQLPGPPPLDLPTGFVQQQQPGTMAMAQNARAIAAQVAAQTSVGMPVQSMGIIGTGAPMQALPIGQVPLNMQMVPPGGAPQGMMTQPGGTLIGGAQYMQAGALPPGYIQPQQPQQPPR